MSITLKRRLSAFSTGELQSGVLPRSVDAKITVVSELISPWQLLRGLRTPWGKANGFFLGKFTALPAQSHGGLVKRWFFPFQLGEFQVPAVNFPGCIYVYIYIHILLTVCWHHPRLMTGSCPTVFQYLLIAIDSMRQGIHFQPLEVSTSQLSSCFPTKGKTENGKFLFSPRSLGKWSNLTSIFFKWVETTNKKMKPPLLGIIPADADRAPINPRDPGC